MSDAAHQQEGQTSDFEFRLVQKDDDSPAFPVDGKYQGWFHLKQAAPLKGSIKIEDKELIIKFISSESDDDGYRIEGHGINKFGSFSLKGTLGCDGSLHMYREYYNLNPVPLPMKRKYSIGDHANKKSKKVLAASGEEPSKKGRKALVVSIPVVEAGFNEGPPSLVREGSGRVRKTSSIMKEYQDTTLSKPAKIIPSVSSCDVKEETYEAFNPTATIKSSVGVKQPALKREITSDRAQRLSQPMKKCLELLKELSKYPQGTWFLEPVDPIKHNVPDYLVIIKKPMDFSTVRGKIEDGQYDSTDGFAEDMRQIFRNAITYNTLSDSLVHIAAREMSNRFEDRYRVLTSQLSGIDAYSTQAILAMEGSKSSRSSMGASSGKTKVRRSLERSSTSSGYTKNSSVPGPRPSAVNMGYLPPALDGNSSQLLEMQRMMHAMQDEITNLRSVVRENEVVKKLNDVKDAAHNPLSLAEKKTLIVQINKLPPDRMEQVLLIINSVLPAKDQEKVLQSASNDIEIPLEILDTFTLRKLQQFVEEHSERRSSMQRQSSGSSSSGTRSGVKRPRKPKAPKPAQPPQVDASAVNPFPNPRPELGLFSVGDEDDGLLFEPESFEELRAQAEHANNMDEDEPEDFAELAHMLDRPPRGWN